MKTDEIRSAYLEFFRAKGHEVVPSDSLVPKDDPTLLFTGAGMNQFKEKFLGKNVTYRRATSSQKCIRTGDLENVGRTSGHHTFFEMLGNFSFGDYFKREAIVWAWEFMTAKLRLDPERLWVSVYKDDAEAYGIWKDTVKVPAQRIVKFGEKDNFWPSEAPTKGPNGPCGPCSEIYFDYGKDVGCGKAECSPACNCGRFIEVWNLVFTQFDRQPDGGLKPLPNKNIDTGMGLERIASVIQGVKTNFEIDIFVPIIAEIEAAAREKPGTGGYRMHTNAIADHIRAVTCTIADGVMPSNTERGYVVRKLIRRALGHCADLGIREPFLYKLVHLVVTVMGGQYPELKAKHEDIAEIVKREEENFLDVVSAQLPKVEAAFRALGAHAAPEAIADAAFNFYDTYGMPYDMLEELAEKEGLAIDRSLFTKRLEEQRGRSRSKTKIKGEIFSETFEKKVAALGLKTDFLGYEKPESEATVLEVLPGGEVILDRTPFYGESGGQAGDWGRIETASGAMEVEDAKKIGTTIVHIGRMLRGTIVKGEKAKAAIDREARARVMRNHTATHLLQAALRKVLGDHVHQTGSLVDADRLRFDFSHMKKLEPRELERVEALVNEYIAKAVAVTKEVKSIDEARREGATALFGEKYDATVRVVTVGDISKELCGGTHVDNTREIARFKITGESSIASGVRRIEALTADAAEAWIREQGDAAAAKEAAERRKDEARKAMAARLQEELGRIDELIARGKAAGAVTAIGAVIPGIDIPALRSIGDAIKAKEKQAVIILATSEGERASFIVSVAKALAESKAANAVDLARDLAGRIGGSAGGRADFAQGGGKEVARLAEAVKETVGRITTGAV